MNPPDLTDVLSEVNRLRAGRGIDALKEMPKGTLSEPHSCPLKHALCLYSVGKRADGSYSMWLELGEEILSTPPVLNAFARAFDDGAYPELQA